MFFTYYGYADSADYFADSMRMIIIQLILGLIMAVVFGLITRKINTSKGYEGGFAWGFFLGWIGIIVVATRRSIKTEAPAYSNAQIDQMVEAQVQQELERIKEEEEKAKRRAEKMAAVNANSDGAPDAMDRFLLLAQDCENDQELLELWEQLHPVEDEEITSFLKNQVTTARMYGGNNCQKSIKKIQSLYKPDSSAVTISKPRQVTAPVYVNAQVKEIVEARVQQRLAQIREEEKKAKQRAEKMTAIRAQNGGCVDGIDQFLALAEDCQKDRELLELWEQLHPVEDEEIEQMLKNSAMAARMYGTNGCQKSINKIRSMYRPESMK